MVIGVDVSEVSIEERARGTPTVGYAIMISIVS